MIPGQPDRLFDCTEQMADSHKAATKPVILRTIPIAMAVHARRQERLRSMNSRRRSSTSAWK
jgi:hypothetical protein